MTEHDDHQAADTEPDDRRAAVRRALAQGVSARNAVRQVRDAYPRGSDERRLASSLVRSLDVAVRRLVESAHTAGIGPGELARIVGVGPSRIGAILLHERTPTAPDPEHPDDQAPDDDERTPRDAAVAELRAAVAARAEVRDTPRSQARADPVRYHKRRTAARMRVCRALVAAHAEGLTLPELAAESDLTTGTIRRILTTAY